MRRVRLLWLAALATGAVAFAARDGVSQALPPAKPDTARADTLARVVVTAERSRTALASVATAVTRIPAAELARTPHATLADLLRGVPGFALVDFDGMGQDPQVLVRGFYGGGEAEYVVVLVDGRPLARLESGLVSWDVLPPLDAIEAVEVVRGGSSALYGDAAIGAVINILTRRPSAFTARRSWGVGSHGGLFGAGDLTGRPFGHASSLAGSVDFARGFRSHSRRLTGHVRGTFDVLERPEVRLALSIGGHVRAVEEPGPLLESLYAQDERQSDLLFRMDSTRDHALVAGLHAERQAAAGARLTGSVTAEWRDVDAVRTLALAPGFGDTRERELRVTWLRASTQAELEDTPLPGSDAIVLGVEAGIGALDSEYYGVLTGDRMAYQSFAGGRGALDAAGAGSRRSAAVFANYAVPLASALRLSLAGRLDLLRDAFEPRVPASGERLTTRHLAFSPKAGLNVRYLEHPDASGHLFVAASRSFKAPTPDQLFDQRPIPVPFPPFTVTISNALLEPQLATSIEGGLNQHVTRGPWRAAMTLGLYQMDLKNELDFDVQTLRYVNIGRSRHRGVEAGLSVTAAPGVAIYMNYTLQSARGRTGEFAGRQLKAIPRHILATGGSISSAAGLEGSLLVTRLHHMYLDDANTRTIPAYSRVDVQLAWRLRGGRIALDVHNALDARYASTGFPDPAGTGEAYFHPAAGRHLRLVMRRGW